MIVGMIVGMMYCNYCSVFIACVGYLIEIFILSLAFDVLHYYLPGSFCSILRCSSGRVILGCIDMWLIQLQCFKLDFVKFEVS